MCNIYSELMTKIVFPVQKKKKLPEVVVAVPLT